MLKFFRKKKEKVYPRKRRIWEHEADPFMETLHMKYRVKAYEVRFAKIKSGISDVPEHLWNCPVEVLFYSRFHCEILPQTENAIPSDVQHIPTNYLDFAPINNKPFPKEVEEGEYVMLKQDMESDDELKEELGEEGDVVLVFWKMPGDDYPYWVYNPETKLYFRLNEQEFERCYKRLPVIIE